MANKKISQLTDGNPALSGDLIPIDRAGANFSLTAASIAGLAGVKVVTVPLTSAQIKSLHSPFTLVTPSSPSLSIFPVLCVAQYTPGSGPVAYTGTSQLNIQTGSTSNQWAFFDSSVLLQTTAEFALSFTSTLADSLISPVSQTQGVALTLISGTIGSPTTPATGDGTLTITLIYIEV